MKPSTECATFSLGVECGSEVSHLEANPINELIVDELKFSKTQEIWFDSEMNNEYVYNLFYRKISKKKYTSATEKKLLY